MNRQPIIERDAWRSTWHALKFSKEVHRNFLLKFDEYKPHRNDLVRCEEERKSVIAEPSHYQVLKTLDPEPICERDALQASRKCVADVWFGITLLKRFRFSDAGHKTLTPQSGSLNDAARHRRIDVTKSDKAKNASVCQQLLEKDQQHHTTMTTPDVVLHENKLSI